MGRGATRRHLPRVLRKADTDGPKWLAFCVARFRDASPVWQLGNWPRVCSVPEQLAERRGVGRWLRESLPAFRSLSVGATPSSSGFVPGARSGRVHRVIVGGGCEGECRAG